jgi:hypothetical protein
VSGGARRSGDEETEPGPAKDTAGATPGGPTPGLAIDPIQSGVFRIDRDGTFRHEGEPVTHPGVLANLHASLRRTGAGGYALAVGPFRIPVVVDDTPLIVTRVESSSAQVVEPESLRLHMSDGATEALDPTTLWLDAAGVPRCLVKAGRFPARLTLAAWLQLAAFLEEGPGDGAPTLVLAGGRTRLAAAPPPGSPPD